ncbi:Hypothetical protein AKI40_0675 [Enterobacter sp. FY-07]|nr:Hypothetical protein AKI40_0675 [Enterobacter sp. FY-07]
MRPLSMRSLSVKIAFTASFPCEMRKKLRYGKADNYRAAERFLLPIRPHPYLPDAA